jgi:hypothetical protein
VSHNFLLQVFVHESSSPQAPDNNIRVFSNFFKNSPRYSQVKVHTDINDTPVSHLPPVLTTPAANYATGTAGVVDTGGKFSTGGK